MLLDINVIIVIKNKRRLYLCGRLTLQLKSFQPWLDLKVYSKVDTSIAEVAAALMFNAMLLK